MVCTDNSKKYLADFTEIMRDLSKKKSFSMTLLIDHGLLQFKRILFRSHHLFTELIFERHFFV